MRKRNAKKFVKTLLPARRVTVKLSIADDQIKHERQLFIFLESNL